MGKTIRTIPATIARYSQTPLTGRKKRRTAAYARVSTDHEDQELSYEAQVDYYTRYINENPDLEFVKVYSDEGISGCNTKGRVGFKQMIEDALAGHMDLIITKSVSRFARNTVDSLSTIRLLKEHGVEVYFEKENIWTFDGKGELLITIMSSLAQEESRSISENVIWGHRKRFADGKVMVPFGRFLGFERGEDGNLVVNQEQAVVVRLIYKLFLEGHTCYTVARMLTERGIPTPGGKEKWNDSCVRSILTNEKYKGDALLQKVFTTDFLTKEKKKNEGEVPQYYVEGNHEAIVSPEVFAQVQAEMERRKQSRGRYSGVGIYASKVKCGECGSWYGSKLWHSTDKYRKTIYRCNRKFKDGKKCETPHLTEKEIQDAFLKAANAYLQEKDELLANAEMILAFLENITELERKKDMLTVEMNALTEQMQNLISENASTALDQEAYSARYGSLSEQYDTKEKEFKEIESQIADRQSRAQHLRHFITTMREQNVFLTEFDADYFCETVDYMTVFSKDDIKVKFKDGSEF